MSSLNDSGVCNEYLRKKGVSEPDLGKILLTKSQRKLIEKDESKSIDVVKSW